MELLLWILITTLKMQGVRTQEPMVCPLWSPGQIFALPRPAECNYTNDGMHTDPVPASYRLYRHNLINFEVSGWLCRAEKETIRLLTYFFDDEHLKQLKTTDVAVDATTCKQMAKTKVSPAGALHQTSNGAWTTGHRLRWAVPGGGIDCCRWHSYQVTNYHLIPSQIYKRHDHDGFSSTTSDVSHCKDYLDGQCDLGSQMLIWKPKVETSCAYLEYKVYNGTKQGNTWISDDKLLALTTKGNETVHDCGKDLHLTDQGIPYEIVFEGKEREENSSHRLKRDVDSAEHSASVVTGDLLAAELQALTNRIRVQTNQAFRRTLRMICNDMEQTTSFLTAMALAEPTETIRVMMNDPYMMARAGNGFMEVWKCSPVPAKDLQVKAQTSQCSKEIPVNFTLWQDYRNETKWNQGYLDPVTLVITHTGTPADCAPTPIHLDGYLYNYQREKGILRKHGEVDKLKIIQYEYTNTHEKLLTPVIFKPIGMYQWDDLMKEGSLNALLAAQTAQMEIFKSMTEPLYSDVGDTEEVESLATNLVQRGMKTIVGALASPFHVWVAITCLLVYAKILWKLWLRFGQPRVIELRRVNQVRRRERQVSRASSGTYAEAHASEIARLSTLEQIVEEPEQVDSNTEEPIYSNLENPLTEETNV